MEFHDLDGKLVVTNGDDAAVWSDDHRKWIKGDAALARRAMTDGQKIDIGKAKSDFPDADFNALPGAG